MVNRIHEWSTSFSGSHGSSMHLPTWFQMFINTCIQSCVVIRYTSRLNFISLSSYTHTHIPIYTSSLHQNGIQPTSTMLHHRCQTWVSFVPLYSLGELFQPSGVIYVDLYHMKNNKTNKCPNPEVPQLDLPSPSATTSMLMSPNPKERFMKIQPLSTFPMSSESVCFSPPP